MTTQMVCPNCGTVAVPKKFTKGSFLMEVLLWLLFVIPGLIYSLWRLTTRYNGCPACKGADLIPFGTPRANEILARRPPG